MAGFNYKQKRRAGETTKYGKNEIWFDDWPAMAIFYCVQENRA